MMYEIQYFWWLMAFVLLILEILTPTTILIFPSIAAIITGLIALKFHSLLAQSIIFFTLTGLFIATIRPLVKKNSSYSDYQSGKDALIGKEGRVIQTIDGSKDQGKVKIAGDVFHAISVNDTVIVEGSKVIIKDIQGIKLLVKERP
ncbi:MAG: NfeD family protein [Brevinema sp.]